MRKLMSMCHGGKGCGSKTEKQQWLLVVIENNRKNLEVSAAAAQN